jgi:hypothetical protein
MQKLGPILIILGALALLGAGVHTLRFGERPEASAGGIAAAGLFIVILGLAFNFPTLLQDDTGATSTMRVVVLMVVSLFVVLTTKAGWSATGVSALDLPANWVWVLAAALGGKAFQSFAENGTGGASANSGSPPAPRGSVARFPRDERQGIQDAP